MSDSLFLYARNKTRQSRYIEIIRPKPEDNRSAEEIASDIIKRAGLVVKKEDEQE